MSHTPHPISRAEFARRAARARSRITEACGPDGALASACLADGNLDAAHPAAQAWAAARGIDALLLLEQAPAVGAVPSLEELARAFVAETTRDVAHRVAAAVRSGAGAVELRSLVHQLADGAFAEARRRLMNGLMAPPPPKT